MRVARVQVHSLDHLRMFEALAQSVDNDAESVFRKTNGRPAASKLPHRAALALLQTPQPSQL